MMRTMLNRIVLAAVACACCILARPDAASAQAGAPDLLVRIDRLENQIRQLTGQVEQMQYRNQQLETELKRIQDDYEFRFQELGARGGTRGVAARAGGVQPVPPPLPPPASGGRRSDAFDPAENPNAPGSPRVLGAIPPQPPAPAAVPRRDGVPVAVGEEPPSRGSGAPFDFAPAGAAVESGPGRTAPAGVPPPRGGPGSTGPVAVAAAPPSSSPRDVYDLGTGYLQRKDYVLAEETFREFLKKYPSDRLAADAQYGLGESLFMRQSFHDAANAFVVLSKKYETSTKAPDALLRLGQSLAAINEKELACVAFGDVGRKYPRAPPGIKQAIEREQKRVRC